MDVLDEYVEELGRDTQLDQFTVRDVQMKLPGIKHKWTGRLIRMKVKRNTLRAKRAAKVEEMTKQLIKASPVTLSIPVAKSKVENHDPILDIDRQLEDTQLVIEFLEKAEKILNSMTFDIRNLTEIMKLETL